MRGKLARGAMIVGIAVGIAACATGPEPEWMKKPYHYASFAHMGFSWRNAHGDARVTRRDVSLATAQGWHGDPLQVKASDVIVE
jgi:hypothetical protein